VSSTFASPPKKFKKNPPIDNPIVPQPLPLHTPVYYQQPYYTQPQAVIPSYQQPSNYYQQPYFTQPQAVMPNYQHVHAHSTAVAPSPNQPNIPLANATNTISNSNISN